MNKKLLIVSKAFVPQVSGSAILLKNLFDEYRGEMEAISGWEYGVKIDKDLKPPCKTTYIRPFLPIIQRLFEKYLSLYFLYLKVVLSRKIKVIKPDVVFIATTPDAAFNAATYYVCKKLNIPFFVHLHDLWEENAKRPFAIKLTNQIEASMFKDAVSVLCMTYHQEEFIKQKHQYVKIKVLPHTTNNANKKSPIVNFNKEILYTGNISRGMNLDALRFFVSIIDELPSDVRITFLTSADKDFLINEKLFHARICYDWVTVEQSRLMQERAGILFLPLSFKNASMLEVQTVFSTKTLDYLNSGTPILVFSPKESFHSFSAEKNGWGLVVNVESKKALSNAIDKLFSDRHLRNELVRNAYMEAQARRSSHFASLLFNWVHSE